MKNNVRIICPVCGNECRKIFKDFIELDECGTCHGIWFDPGEFSAAIELKEIKSSFPCPFCGGMLTEQEVMVGVEIINIHKCKSCHGIWIDGKNIQIFSEQGKKGIDKIRFLFPGVTIRESEYHPGLYIFSLIFNVPVEIYRPVRIFPKGLFLLVMVNIFIFLFLPSSLFEIYGLISSNAFSLSRLHSFITYGFFHAGFLHLLLNMYMMWIFGDNLYSRFIERHGKKDGVIRFFSFSVMCIIFSGLTHVILVRVFGNPDFLNIPLVGASGLVSAYIAAYYREFPDARIYQVLFFIPFKFSVKIYLIIYVATNLLLAYRHGANSMVS